ncbi:CPBP family glutamic-type intramembrane protease [Flavitalea sp.]|nr:CPBP family glutamic-type intramembrane protease [Flavitalea sp.]
MKKLAGYILQYTRELNTTGLFLISVLTAFFIYLNYQYHIEVSLLRLHNPVIRFLGFLVLYLLMFGGSYLVLVQIRQPLSATPFFLVLIILAPAIYAWRMSSKLITSQLTWFLSAPWDKYWALILNPPVKCLIILFIIFLLKKRGVYGESITGLQRKNILIRPFLIMLICFIPVVIIAGIQPDFRMAYPKATKVNFVADHISQPWITALIFEISYAFDFLIAEVFFRGFLVLAFIRYAGPAAILPMASFYCAIHFGKPLIECISSFFGAIMLGAISYRTGSVLGGLFLHLGLGWMMEVIGFLMRF